jgi:PAS domain S-box-containing protein
MSYPLPSDEPQRQAALDALNILDTPAEPAFDRITNLAARLLGFPVALVPLLDHDRQWFKSAQGVDIQETPRDVAFCAHAIMGDEVFVVRDATQDERFADNPLVTGPTNIHFYAGAPLRTADGYKVGSLCVIDTKPREWTEEQSVLLSELAAILTDEIELRQASAKTLRQSADLERAHNEMRGNQHKFQALIENALDVISVLDLDGTILYESPSVEKVLGFRSEDLVGINALSLVHPNDQAFVVAALQKLWRSRLRLLSSFDFATRTARGEYWMQSAACRKIRICRALSSTHAMLPSGAPSKNCVSRKPSLCPRSQKRRTPSPPHR